MCSIFRSARLRAAAVCISFFFTAAPAFAMPGFAPGKFAAVSMDAGTGEILYSQNAEVARYPASLTKVMTLFLAFDALKAGRLHLGDRVRISAHAAAQPPSKLGLKPGASLTVRDALNVIIVRSANDIAVALAERLGGSEAAFVRRMNVKAAALGMRRTHFANASGLPDRRNVTTAEDLAILGRAMLHDHPRRYALFDQTQTRFRGRVIRGHNPLVGRADIDGMKTGYIGASGFNLLTSGVHDGRRIVAVVLGGSTAAVRDRFMGRLMDASFAVEAQEGAKPARVADLLAGRAIAAAQPPRDEPTAEADADSSGWRVQVGAFSTAEAGSARIAQISRDHPRHFDPEDGRVLKSGDLYLARFTADSQEGAEEACALLHKEGADCLWLVHGGG